MNHGTLEKHLKILKYFMGLQISFCSVLRNHSYSINKILKYIENILNYFNHWIQSKLFNFVSSNLIYGLQLFEIAG